MASSAYTRLLAFRLLLLLRLIYPKQSQTIIKLSNLKLATIHSGTQASRELNRRLQYLATSCIIHCIYNSKLAPTCTSSIFKFDQYLAPFTLPAYKALSRRSTVPRRLLVSNLGTLTVRSFVFFAYIPHRSHNNTHRTIIISILSALSFLRNPICICYYHC